METFPLPGSVFPSALIPSGSGSEGGAASVCQSVCGERRPGVLGRDVDSATVRLSPCPALLESGVRGDSAGCGRLPPASAQLPPEEVVWAAVCEERRRYPRPGKHRGAPCFLPGSAHCFPKDEPLKAGWLRGVEGVWMVWKRCLAAVLVEFWEGYAKARGRQENGH